MRLLLIAASILALGACSGAEQGAQKEQAAPKASAEPALASCVDVNKARDVANALDGAPCQLTFADGRTALVTPAPVGNDAEFGNVTIVVRGKDGAPLQTIEEAEATSYLPVTAAVEDVDGDGREDIAVNINQGNVNTTAAVWAFREKAGKFVRLGEINAVDVSRTSEGLLALSTRENAATYGVEFVRVDQESFTSIASFELTPVVDGKGAVTRTECKLLEGPGLAAMKLTPQAATAKFCAEPSAKVE
jgi:hypothetical protein